MARPVCPVCAGEQPAQVLPFPRGYLGTAACGGVVGEWLGFARTTTADPLADPDSPLRPAPVVFFSLRDALPDGRWLVVDFVACRLTVDGLVLEAHVWASHPLQTAIRGWQVPTQPFSPLGWVEPQLQAARTLLVALAAAVHGKGRPRGSGTFARREEFIRLLRQAISAVRDSGRRPTQERIATYFCSQTGYPSCDVRQLRRWVRSAGFDDWAHVLREVTGAS